MPASEILKEKKENEKYRLVYINIDSFLTISDNKLVYFFYPLKYEMNETSPPSSYGFSIYFTLLAEHKCNLMSYSYCMQHAFNTVTSPNFNNGTELGTEKI